jgi:hypothetical protein
MSHGHSGPDAAHIATMTAEMTKYPVNLFLWSSLFWLVAVETSHFKSSARGSAGRRIQFQIRVLATQ